MNKKAHYWFKTPNGLVGYAIPIYPNIIFLIFLLISLYLIDVSIKVSLMVSTVGFLSFFLLHFFEYKKCEKEAMKEK